MTTTSTTKPSPDLPEKAEKPKAEFNTYKASRMSIRLITPKGKSIAFVNYAFITKDSELIEYLDSELTNASLGITKGEPVTTNVVDPLAGLRAKFYEEFKAKQAAELVDVALGKSRDMGTYSSTPGLKAATTKDQPKA